MFVILLSMVFALSTIFFYCQKNKWVGKNAHFILKLISLCFAIFFVIRLLNKDLFLDVSISFGGMYENNVTILLTLLRWSTLTAVLIMLVTPFYKNKYLTTLIICFVLPVAFINSIFFSINIESMGIPSMFHYRSIFYALEQVAIVLYSSLLLIKRKEFPFIKSKKEIFILIGTLIGLYYLMISIDMPKIFFGNTSFIAEEFGFVHRLVLYYAVGFPALIFMLFKNKDYQSRHLIVLLLSLAGCIHFFDYYTFLDFTSVTNLPLHLCHTAMILMPICVIFKTERLYYFTYFVNVTGAFFALIIPNMSAPIFSTGAVHFWINHWYAFFLPFLIMGLGIYGRPNIKRFKRAVEAFVVYYVFIVFINAWFSNYGTVDYFFVNSTFFIDKIPAAKPLRDFVVTFTFQGLNFTFYPIYQATIFVVFVLCMFGIWYIYELFFTIAASHKDFGNKRKIEKIDYLNLLKDLQGRAITQPVNIGGEHMIKFINFTKYYGSSKNKAVDDFNLEVHEGEIFGFLGHNGAGKSTTIKSLVGIQTISEGKIEIFGYDIARQPIEAKLLIGYVPDHYSLYERLTGREYVNYVADLYHVCKKDRDERIEKYVNMFELSHAFDNIMKTYSHGMKQKITIIAALIHDPKVWILDEPLTGLDPTSVYQIKECMKEHARRGNIVFFSSHIIDVVEKICTKIAIIKKGKLQVVKTLKEIGEGEETLEQLYLSLVQNKNEVRK